MRATNKRDEILRRAIAAAVLWSSAASAADLKPETLRQWQDYVKTADARNRQHVASGCSFLSSDEIPNQIARLQAGEIVVAPAGTHAPVKVTGGLIHDWTGAAFLPNTNLGEVLPVVRDYDRYKDYYQPNVADSREVAVTDSGDHFSMVIINTSVLAKTALDADFR